MPLYSPPTFPAVAPAAAQYFFTASPNSVTTSVTLGVGSLRLTAWVLTRAMALDRIGAEVTTIGEAGSKFRLGIYADNGNSYPGALVVDAGQIAGDSATVQELTIAVTLAAGLYWVGGAVQSVVTTQPTMRTINNWTPPVPLSAGTSAPSAGALQIGYTQSSVTGALPANYTATPAGTSIASRVHLRAA
jgi:hypothetical protein